MLDADSLTYVHRIWDVPREVDSGTQMPNWEAFVDGLAEHGSAYDSTNRLHLQGTNRFRYLNSMVIAARTTTQSISDNTWTVLALSGTDVLDTDTLHDPSSNNSRLIAAIAGKYFFFISFGFESNATGIRAVTVEKNSAGVETLGNALVLADINATNGGETAFALSGFVSLAVNDYIETFVYQNSTISLNIVTTTAINFGMAYLGE